MQLLDAAFVYVNEGYRLDGDTARDLARIADFVCAHRREPDSGIWEVRARPRQHTQSKAMCWVALDRAVRMAHTGRLPAKHAERWSTEAGEIRRIHPRMGTSITAANSAPLLEPPGFMLVNYGRATPVVTIVAHLAYGAIVGAFTDAASM